MSKYERWRNAILMVWIACAGLIWLSLAHLADASQFIGNIVMAISAIVAVFALPFAISSQVHIYRLTRLRRGAHVIARWRVDPATWQQFVAFEQAVDGTGDNGQNLLAISGPMPAADIEVVVGWREILVGNDFHIVERSTLKSVEILSGPPICLDFIINVSNPNGADYTCSIRFPVPVDAQGEAARVREHFTSGRFLTSRPR